MIGRRQIAFVVCAAFCAIAIDVYPLNAIQQWCCPAMNVIVQDILHFVNAQSGASESLPGGTVIWTYSLTLDDPCMLNLTEEKHTVKKGISAAAVMPTREITHYLIPAGDLEFGRFSTHQTLETQGFMRVILFTRHATIRRWYGDVSIPPEDAAVLYVAEINFGKPNVDIFQVPLLFQDTLQNLSSLCRTSELGAN